MAIDKNKAIANAQRYTQKGQLDRALKEYQAIVAEDPEDVRIWLKIGDLYTKKGAVSQAVSTYARVAVYYSERGFFLKAVAVWKQILNIDPAYTDAHLKLAELYVQLGLAPDAIGQYQLVVAAYEREGRHRDSVQLLKKIVELAPEDVPNRIRLAEAHARQNENPKAVEEFKVVLEQLHARERWDEAIQVGERVAYLAPDDTENLRLVSEVYLRRGDARRALARLQACFKAAPTDIVTLELLARAFTELGQTAKAVSVHRELARLHEAAGNAPGRLEAFRRILVLDPTDVEAISVTGGGRAREAAQAQPLPAQVLFTQGVTSTQGMQRLGAIAQPVEAMTPEDAVRRHLLDIDLLLKYGLGEHALQTTDKILALEPESEQALVKRKDIALAIGRRDEAIAAILKLAGIVEGRSPDQAMAWLGEALQISPNHPEANAKMQRLSSGMAAGLRRGTGPAPAAPAIIETAPADDYPDLDLGALDFGDERAPGGGGQADGGVDDLEFNFDDEADLDAPPAPAMSGEVEAVASDEQPPPAEDDFGGLLDGGEDDFHDLLHGSDEPAQLSVEAPAVSDEAPAFSEEAPAAFEPGGPTQPVEDDEFGGLLVGPRVSSPAALTPIGGIALQSRPTPATTPVRGVPAFTGIPGAPTPQPISDDFGDLAPMDLPDDDFSDLLSDEIPPSAREAEVSVEPLPATAGGDDELDFGDLMPRDSLEIAPPAEPEAEPEAEAEPAFEPEAAGEGDASDEVGDDPAFPRFIAAETQAAAPPREEASFDLGDLLPADLEAAPAAEEAEAPLPAPVEDTNFDLGDLLPSDLQGALDAAARDEAEEPGELEVPVDFEAPAEASETSGASVESAAVPAAEASIDASLELDMDLGDLAVAEPAVSDEAFEVSGAAESADDEAQAGPAEFDIDVEEPVEAFDFRLPEIEEPAVENAEASFAVHEAIDAVIHEGDQETGAPGATDDVAAALSELLPGSGIEGPGATPDVADAFGDLGEDEGEYEDPDRTVFAAPESLTVASAVARVTTPAPAIEALAVPDASDEAPAEAEVAALPPTPAPAAIEPFDFGAEEPEGAAEPAAVDLEAEVASLPGVQLDFGAPDDLGPLEAGGEDEDADGEAIEEVEEFELIDDDLVSLEDEGDDLGPVSATEGLDEDEDAFEARPRRPMMDARTVVASVTVPDIEDELAEVDFLLESGLATDARDALEDPVSNYGLGHPAIQARLRRIEELEAVSREAESVVAAMAFSEPTPAVPLAAASVEELSDADVAAHFDLGVAYMEMGQYRKAISQLQKVAEHRDRRSEALRVIALCELQQGNAHAAVRSLESALAVPGLSRDGRVGLLYDLATAYETLGNRIAARTQLKSILDLGAGDFLDVRERLGRLANA